MEFLHHAFSWDFLVGVLSKSSNFLFNHIVIFQLWSKWLIFLGSAFLLWHIREVLLTLLILILYLGLLNDNMWIGFRSIFLIVKYLIWNYVIVGLLKPWEVFLCWLNRELVSWIYFFILLRLISIIWRYLFFWLKKWGYISCIGLCWLLAPCRLSWRWYFKLLCLAVVCLWKQSFNFVHVGF